MCHIVPQLLQTVSRVDVEDEGSLAGGQVEDLHGHCKGSLSRPRTLDNNIK